MFPFTASEICQTTINCALIYSTEISNMPTEFFQKFAQSCCKWVIWCAMKANLSVTFAKLVNILPTMWCKRQTMHCNHKETNKSTFYDTGNVVCFSLTSLAYTYIYSIDRKCVWSHHNEVLTSTMRKNLAYAHVFVAASFLLLSVARNPKRVMAVHLLQVVEGVRVRMSREPI